MTDMETLRAEELQDAQSKAVRLFRQPCFEILQEASAQDVAIFGTKLAIPMTPQRPSPARRSLFSPAVPQASCGQTWPVLPPNRSRSQRQE